MATQRCPRCGRNIPDPVNVCTHCGKNLGTDRPEREGLRRIESCTSVLVLLMVVPMMVVGLVIGYLEGYLMM